MGNQTALAQKDSVDFNLEEAIQLASEDGIFFGEYFFPKTFRQAPAPAHKLMWDALLGPSIYVAFMIFRGAAKTSVVRVFIAFLISFGIARTVLVVGKSEGAASRTLEWLMRAVEFNKLWTDAFHIRQGEKWNATEIDVKNEGTGTTTRVIAMGIGGSTRGVNVDDYRPDIILVDDPCDEENTATPDQRSKLKENFFGALFNSLAPPTEAPMSKMILLQTVLNDEDLISDVMKDSQWESYRVPVFTETGESAWPSRFPLPMLEAQKQGFIDRGMLHVWLREMECTVVSAANSAFRADLLQYWTVTPEEGRTLVAVDPTPPPRDGSPEAYQGKLDDAAIRVLRLYKHRVYVIDWYETKSPDPFELISKIFELAVKHGAKELVVETVLFARVLASIHEREMLQRRMWFILHKVEGKEKKDTRIRQEVGAALAARALVVNKADAVLVSQIIAYPAVNHDDAIDALAIGLKILNRAEVMQKAMDEGVIEGEFEDLSEEWLACP